MQQEPQNSTAELVTSWGKGDAEAQEILIERLYPWLREVAAGMLRNEHAVSLSSGDLVHEVVVRLIKLETIKLEDRAHFMALAAKVMHRVLIDHMRAKRSNKRDHMRVTLMTHLEGEHRADLASLNMALQRLGALDPVKAEIVEMRYFGGMSIPDVAIVTGLSETTVKRRWMAARIWLIDAMEGSR